MKQKLFLSLSISLCFLLLFTACKKNESQDQDPPDQADVSSHAEDESAVSAEIDAAAYDANLIMESNATLSGDNSTLQNVVCDAEIAFDLESDPMTATVIYNGSACSNKRTRTGKVIVAMAKGTKWQDAGALITLTFQDLKIVRNSDSAKITLNGTQSFINVSGGLLSQLASLQTITHTITSNELSVKFGDGDSRKWQVARKTVYTYNNGANAAITGLHTEGDLSGIAEWGSNRQGVEFTTQIVEPIEVKQSCDLRVTSGIVKHSTKFYSATVTFGLDASGAVTSCPGLGHYYYKLNWTLNNQSIDVLLPY
ncbi:MAG TPA: hypothetical protein VK625_04310 [Flavitalea sp.]|nr:hypothetical protein [Flavitalea sp.]